MVSDSGTLQFFFFPYQDSLLTFWFEIHDHIPEVLDLFIGEDFFTLHLVFDVFDRELFEIRLTLNSFPNQDAPVVLQVDLLLFFGVVECSLFPVNSLE